MKPKKKYNEKKQEPKIKEPQPNQTTSFPPHNQRTGSNGSSSKNWKPSKLQIQVTEQSASFASNELWHIGSSEESPGADLKSEKPNLLSQMQSSQNTERGKKKQFDKVKLIKKEVIEEKPSWENKVQENQLQTQFLENTDQCFQEKRQKTFKKRYEEKNLQKTELQKPEKGVNFESSQESDQEKIAFKKQQNLHKNTQCQMKNMIPESDYKKFMKLCVNVYASISNLHFFYSEKRPLLFCSFKQNNKTCTEYLADIVHLNRKANITVDIQLLWRTYDLLYKQVPEDFWRIAKFGMVRAEQKNKFWAKSINIYKHKEMLKLYFVIDRKQIHFLLLHKQFRRIEYSTSYIEQKKLDYPYQFRSFEKFKRHLSGNKSKQDIEADDEIDSEFEQLQYEEEDNQKFYRERLKQIINIDLCWLHQELKGMAQRLEDMEFGQKRTQLYHQAMHFEKMIKEFEAKQQQIKTHLKKKEGISAIELKLLTKSMIITQKQLESKLPICIQKKEIFSLLAKQNIIVLQGETGSGKSTQLPQILFEYYEVSRKLECLPILITQPRKIAARTLAHRVAEQLEEKIHGLVDYQCSSYKKVNQNAKIIFKLDRLVLDQLTEDPLLSKYCCLVVDEAHERTISIDVILGRLKNILEKRKDFRIIITSASMDAVKFAEYYKTIPKKIPGRMYPVETQYAPMNNFKDTRQKIENFIKIQLFERDLSKQKDQYYGHTLVFCPGIEDVEILVEKFRNLLDQRSFIVLALHSKLTSEKQRQVFKDQGKVKIIFTTKIAQTSITINGIKVVVNPGIDREIVYDEKTRVSSLQLKIISKSQAFQRAGRAGRTSSGFCFNLYSQQQEINMKQNKPPEILAIPPDTIVLRLKALKVADIYKFPFLDAPSTDNMRMSIQTLKFLGCLDFEDQITQIGKLVLLFPIEPFLSRSIIQSLFYSYAIKSIDRSQLKMPSQQIEKLQKINLVGQVTKILCLLINTEDLYLKTKGIKGDKDLKEEEILIDYNMDKFQGEFDFLSTLYDDFVKIRENRKTLKKWSDRNKISVKSLNQSKQMQEETTLIIQGFQKNIKQMTTFKRQLVKKMSILSTLESVNQVVHSCLLISLINYLSIFSEVPELGYTMLSKKTPILLDQNCVNSKIKEKNYSKWAICFNITVDQFNRVITKSCQPVNISLIKKVIDQEIFNFLQMQNIDKFNPFYHKLPYQLPTIIFSKIVADYKKKNFDPDLDFLCPYTFVINEKESSFAAYHDSTTPFQKLKNQLDNYIDKIKWPLQKPLRYNFTAESEITFDKDFKLQSINKKDTYYGFNITIPDIIYNKYVDRLMQSSYFQEIPTMQVQEKTSVKMMKISGVIVGSQNMKKFGQTVKYIEQNHHAIERIKFDKKQIQLSKTQNSVAQRQVFIEIQQVNAATTCFLIEFKRRNQQFQPHKLVRCLSDAEIDNLKYIRFMEKNNYYLEEFLSFGLSTKIKTQFYSKAAVCYFYENEASNRKQLQNALNQSGYKYRITDIKMKNAELLELSNQDWVKRLEKMIEPMLSDQIYKKYKVEFVRRSFKQMVSKQKVNFQNDKNQEKKDSSLLNVELKTIVIQMKVTSRCKELCERLYLSQISIEETLQKQQTKSNPGYHLEGGLSLSSKFYCNELVMSVPSAIFEVLEVYFYENCQKGPKGPRSYQIYHKKSQNFKGTPTTEILIRYEQNNPRFLGIEKTEKIQQIKNIFTPKQIKVDAKYAILLKSKDNTSTCKKFTDLFEQQENFQVKLISMKNPQPSKYSAGNNNLNDWRANCLKNLPKLRSS